MTVRSRIAPCWIGLLCAVAFGALTNFTALADGPSDSQQDTTRAVTAGADSIAEKGKDFTEIQVATLPRRQFGYRSIMGDIIALKDGRLLAVYGKDGITTKTPNAIVASYSTDQGATWGAEFALVPCPQPEGKGAYMHPGLTQLANGDILLNYIYVTRDRPFCHAFTFYRRSLDGGMTWSDQFPMTTHPGWESHNDKLIQLTTGRLLLPVHVETDAGDDHQGYESSVYFSDDDGYSWRRSSNSVNLLPIEAQEPHVVELKDGRVMMLMRTYNRSIARAYSSDQGSTWSKGELIPNLPLSPNASAINVQRIPKTGDLLLLRTSGGDDGRRTPFVSAISNDDGQTWTHERTIAGDPAEDYGYPSITFVDDRALIFYHKRDGLYLARISTDWFYGK